MFETDFTRSRSELPGNGGQFVVAGFTTAAIAAALAAGSVLASLRLNPTSTRAAVINSIRMMILGVTVGTSGLVPGIMAWQKFNTATPTGGTARTPGTFAAANNAAGTQMTSDMFDIRDGAAALTTTGAVFADIYDPVPVPIMVSNGALWMDWVLHPFHPIILAPGEGICFRCQAVMPATQTWGFSYRVAWDEEQKTPTGLPQ